MATETEGYTGKDGSEHRAGSRKSKIHQIFDKQGREAAVAAGKKMKLKDATLSVWTSTWARGGKSPARKNASKGAVKGKTSAKKPAKRAKRKTA